MVEGIVGHKIITGDLHFDESGFLLGSKSDDDCQSDRYQSGKIAVPSSASDGFSSASGRYCALPTVLPSMGMTHTSTAAAKRREADRLRKRLERAERKAAGAPSTHHVDLAVAEAMSFTLALSLPAGAETIPADATLSVKDVVTVAIRILIKRWRFDKLQAAKALQARIGKRSEHLNPLWYPHFPSAEPSFWKDLSTLDSANTPVTTSGRVRSPDDEVTEI